MKEMKEILIRKKDEIYMTQVPEEMEDCLRSALQKKRRHFHKSAVAAVFAAVLIVIYSFDSIAYYGKKFIGYDNMLYGNLKELFDEGRGQEINKSCTFSDGLEFTLDAIMFDGNELMAFCRMYHPEENLVNSGPTPYNDQQVDLIGINPLGYDRKIAFGSYLDEHTLEYIYTFEAPAFYEKWMKLNIKYRLDNNMEEKTIDFILDRSKAIETSVQKDINAKVRVGDCEVLFDKITASAMKTYIQGSITPLSDEAKKKLDPESIEDYEKYGMTIFLFDMVSDKGESVDFHEADTKASMGKVGFINEGDALPKDFNTLEIKNIRLERHKPMEKSVDISERTENLKVDDDVLIKSVYFEGDTTCVVVSSRGIPSLELYDGDEYMETINSIYPDLISPDSYEKQVESEEPVDRVFRFEGKGQNMRLDIKYIVYYSYSDETISIPID